MEDRDKLEHYWGYVEPQTDVDADYVGEFFNSENAMKKFMKGRERTPGLTVHVYSENASQMLAVGKGES